MFLGFLGKNLCKQACSCMHKPLPKNPKFCFLFVLLMFSHVCLLVFYHMLELGFILCFIALMLCICIHMIMHDVIGAKLLQSK